jgi:branched-chain amino acid transport system ATP-binding protein
MPILDVTDLSIQFGGLKAVTKFNLKMEQGELIGLIGPNGAGKTTVFNMLTGVYTPTSGTAIFTDRQGKIHTLNNKQAWQIARVGITRTFQNIRLFKRMTVLDNVRLSFHPTAKYFSIHAILRLPQYLQEEARIREKSMELLRIFNLDSKADELSASLPYGEQRKLEIARALACNPQILLLDEPAAGMNPQETADLSRLITFIRDKFNLTILLIEHDMSLVMKICERILVLDYGELIAQGLPDEIRNNPQVIKAYLGEEVPL